MKSLVYKGPRQLSVCEQPARTVGIDEVEIAPIAVGICGSDVHGYLGETGRRQPGLVMGHEIVGRITAVGDSADSRLTVGDSVVVNPVVGCAHCEYCRGGNQDLCEQVKVMGVDVDLPGGLAERLVLPIANAVPVPIAEPVCALTEPFAVGLHAARRGGVAPGTTVAVIGSGMVGVATAWGAIHEGAVSVVVVDIDPEKLAGATRIGARGLAARPGQPLTEVLEAAGLPKVDVVLDVVGTNETIRSALGATRRGGTVVLVGMATPSPSLPDYALITNQQHVVGTWCYNADDFETAARAVSGAPAEFDWLIDHKVELTDAPGAFAQLSSGYAPKFKVLVIP
ncbi:zinc-dependent alcohol dehydrogenase [Rhodococcus sp. ACT016]|uniref:zinc-dependent alcohol dehydrogenase n=1 Tax=Rhodococcus sp. ACT016 TaxID=3134808 RepID=UPI003D2686F3